MEIHNVKLEAINGDTDGLSRLYSVTYEFLNRAYIGKRLIITYEELKEVFPFNSLLASTDKKEIRNQLKIGFKNSWLYGLNELRAFRVCYSNDKPNKYRSLYEQILYYSDHRDFCVDLKTYSVYAVSKLLREYIEAMFSMDLDAINTCFNNEIKTHIKIPVETLQFILEDAINQIRNQLGVKQPNHKQAMMLTVENSSVLINTLGLIIHNKQENTHGA
jgi:hypothetical protein